MASILDLTDDTFDSEVAKTGRTLVVLFWSTSDEASKAFMAIFNQLADQYPAITFARVEVSGNQTAASHAGIQAVPTTLAFKDGQRVGQILGARPISDIKSALDGL